MVARLQGCKEKGFVGSFIARTLRSRSPCPLITPVVRLPHHQFKEEPFKQLHSSFQPAFEMEGRARENEKGGGKEGEDIIAIPLHDSDHYYFLNSP